jgi:hypothetical protein
MDKFWFLYHALHKRLNPPMAFKEYMEFEPDLTEQLLVEPALDNIEDEGAWLALADRLEETKQDDESELIRAHFATVYTDKDKGGWGYLSTVNLSKLVREKLARRFPNVKFWVRSHSYSMGSSIDVYFDGTQSNAPPRIEVDKYLDRYEGSEFDGMDDCKRSRRRKVMWRGKCYQISTDFIHVENHAPNDARQYALKAV